MRVLIEERSQQQLLHERRYTTGDVVDAAAPDHCRFEPYILIRSEVLELLERPIHAPRLPSVLVSKLVARVDFIAVQGDAPRRRATWW